MRNVFEYDVFLSFASKDEDLVKSIWQEMSLSGLRVFWSDETLKQNIGQSFFTVIQNALVQSRHFVLICSTNALESKWVQLEYETFYSECYLRSVGVRRFVIFPIKDFPLSELPPFLKSLQRANSVSQMISVLGGIDIQAIKAENLELKRKLELSLNECMQLQNDLAQKQNQISSLRQKLDYYVSQKESLEYEFPPLYLLEAPIHYKNTFETREELINTAKTLEARLIDFDVEGKVVEINPGLVITRYEYEPAPGMKINRIIALADELALAMRARPIRILAPTPGKTSISIELPNPEPQIVYLRKLIDSDTFRQSPSPLTVAFGETISGQIFVRSLDHLRHLLVAGAAGSGKSICLQAIISSLLYKAHPSNVQLLIVDLKRLELFDYRKLRFHHLTFCENINEEVVTIPQNAITVLRSLEWELEKRVNTLAHANMPNIIDYNTRLKEGKLRLSKGMSEYKPLPYIVLVIDDLADLMLVAKKEAEEYIVRLAQKAHLVGIHIVGVTQNLSVDVITNMIKVNFPTRIALKVDSKADSRMILDMNGAEKLLGSGDMLFLPSDSLEPIRIHGAYISSEETNRVVEHVHKQPICDKELLPIRIKR